MSFYLKTTTLGAVLFAAMAVAPASLAQESLEIRNFVGSINWSNGPLSVEIEKNAGDTKIKGSKSVTIDGGISDIDGKDCKSAYGRYDFDFFGKNRKGHFGGYKGLDNLPILKITLPEETKLILRDSIIFTEGTPNVGELDVEMSYCGEITLGDVTDTVAVDSRGSADITFGNSGQIVAYLKGSGDLTGGDSSDVLIKSNGSADVKLGQIKSLEITMNGSGDTQLGSVGSGLSYSGHGSGDFEVDSVEGAYLELSSHGSGDIDIHGGRVGKLTVSVHGSADVEFDGKAETANLRTSGSGDVFVERVTGSVEIKTSGSGDVEVDKRS